MIGVQPEAMDAKSLQTKIIKANSIHCCDCC